MYLSLKWLKKFLPDLKITNLEEFKFKVDTRLSEVESIVEVGRDLDRLVIAEIKSIEAHPKHENLKVCMVNVGQEKPLQIVCGAENAREGLWSVAVLPGGKVYDSKGKPVEITKRDVAGVESNGMLCAPDELGLSDDHKGIIELPEGDTPVGTDVTEEFRDVVIEIENKALPHRPDAFSHLGIARELSAIFNLELKVPAVELPRSHADNIVDITIDNKVSDLVTRYNAVYLENVQIKPSPLWMQISLARTGERAKNNVVDITNYVMHHVGQPLHAFDAAAFPDHKIVVRKAKQDETIQTIDGDNQKLSKTMIAIANKSEVVAVAGIMGGKQSEITAETTNIMLEAANFEMYTTRRTSRELGLRTQASSRYEKGLPNELTEIGINHAANLLASIAGAELASELAESYPKPDAAKVINFDLSQIKKQSGVTISKSEVAEALENLGFKISGLEKFSNSDISRNDVGLNVEISVPWWRKDINIPADIIEEVTRLYGYENVKPTLPARNLSAPLANNLLNIISDIKQTLAAAGGYEIYTYSMVGDDLYNQAGMDSSKLLGLKNPISPELSKVRDSLIPSVIEKVALNLDRYDEFSLFEIGKTVDNQQKLVDGLPVQDYKLAIVTVADKKTDAYLKLKYLFDKLNSKFGNQIVINPENKEQFNNLHPKVQAGLNSPKNDAQIGQIGLLHPGLASNIAETKHIALLEINLTELIATDAYGSRPEFRNLNNYPVVIRDISLWQKPETYVAGLQAAIATELSENLFNQEIVDVFDKDDRRSVTLRLKLQADHTLEAEEITEIMQRVAQVITQQGHEVR